jgi:hypothetical protein
MTLPQQQTAQGSSEEGGLPKFATFQSTEFDQDPCPFQIQCAGSATPFDMQYLHINTVYHIKALRMK